MIQLQPVQKCNPKDLMYELVPFLEKNSSLFMKVRCPHCREQTHDHAAEVIF